MISRFRQMTSPLSHQVRRFAGKEVSYTSGVFQGLKCRFDGDHEELVYKGGRNIFNRIPEALEGIRRIGIVGWSSQGPAQAMNLRDTLKSLNSEIQITVGLRQGSSSIEQAEAAGFSFDDGSLNEMWKVIQSSDMVILLVSDPAIVEIFPEVQKKMKPNSTLGLSHGFLLGYMHARGLTFREDLDVVLVAPKGFGPSVRRLYVQGESVNGAGINASFAIEKNVSGKAVERALAWGIGIGSPYLFPTTMTSEYCSDIFGERCVLLGGIHGIIEFLYRHYVASGISKEDAFRESAESLTGPISRTITNSGLIGVYKSLSEDQKQAFEIAYSQAYRPFREITEEVYDEVESGREISSVLDHWRRIQEGWKMQQIDNTETWKVGEKVRAGRGNREINPTTAGVYLAGIVAQCDVLYKKGHCASEIVNESIIEAVDSLNPYIDFKGVAFMIDNCSTVARLGARKWAPRFDYLLTQQAGSSIFNGSRDDVLIEEFRRHRIHEVLRKASEMRPPVDISVINQQHGQRF